MRLLYQYIKNNWPIVFFLAVWAFFAAPYFFSGKVPFPSTYQVDFFPPWSAYDEMYPSIVKNNAMPDIISQIYPWKHFTIEQLKKGNIPFWNPNNFAGNPHVANSQSAVFSPFNLLYFLLPFIDAWSITLLLQPLIAGISTYIFARELKISKIGAVLSAITFAFCGFMTVWMAYGTLSMAIAFLPLVLFGIQRAFGKRNAWYFSFVSVGIPISIFSGHIQTSFYLCLFSAVYFIFAAVQSRSRKLAVWGILSFGIGLCISIIQVYPTMHLYAASVRSESLHLGGGIPWNYLVTLFAPDFYGNPVTRNDWFGTYAEWSSFIGIIPLMLGFIALRLIQSNRTILFFGIAGFLTLLFSMETPLHGLLLATQIPIIATSIPSRMIVLFSFSFAVLAGFGLDVLHKAVREKKLNELLPGIIAIGGILSIIWVSLFVFHVLPNDKNQLSIAIKNSILPTVLYVVSFMAIMMTFLFPIKKHKVLIVNGLLLLFLVLASFDSYRFAAKWMPFDPREFVFPDIPVVKTMQKEIGDGRIFGNLGTQVETYYNLPSLEGYDPLYIERYGEFIRFAAAQKQMKAERSVARVDRRSPNTERVLDMLGVTHIFHPIADTNQSWAFPVWENHNKYSVVYQDERYQLFRNNQAFPRAKMFYAFDVIKEDREILKQLFDESFDFRRTVVLEEQPDGLRSSESGVGDAKIEAYDPTKVRIHVKTDKPGLLFLSDAYYDRWHVKVNDKPEKLYRTNYAFRGVVVPAGESEVEFYYKEF